MNDSIENNSGGDPSRDETKGADARGSRPGGPLSHCDDGKDSPGKFQTEHAEARACYDKAMELIQRHRDDEAAAYFKTAADMGHVEARKFLNLKKAIDPAAFGPKKRDPAAPGKTGESTSWDETRGVEEREGRPRGRLSNSEESNDPPETIDTEHAEQARACYDKGMDLIKRFRDDEAAGYMRKAAELGHVEARNYLASNVGSQQVSMRTAAEQIPGERHKIEFSGSAEEYFRIWIVNAFLTIITLGIYAAWAKVRTRRYFYANTTLDGQPFDYLADPIAILKGHLIVGVGFIIYFIGQRYNPTVSIVVIIVFYVFLPLLVYKSLRFYMHNSSYRNIRFRFTGTLGESYRTYFLIPLLFPLTLGLITPYWAFRKKKYFYTNVTLGTTNASFKARPGPFYSEYISAFLIMVGMGFIASIFIGLLAAAITAFSTDSIVGMLVVFIAYPIYIIVFSIYEQFLYTRLTNYSWNSASLGNIRFESTLSVGKMIKIRITNIFAIILSIGLLIPWAKIRRTRYVLDNLFVITEQDFNEFTAETGSDESAVGDAATEFFDIEVGL